ncbi:MAG: STAS/SEC14 domain-containing protein [Bacteroidota bacterium]|nr:STAS/SEC14 domain-containing protein [Bacteroidota bacterium]
MEYTYEIVNDDRIIKVKASGEITPKEAAIMGKNIRIKAKELSYKILFDLRQAENKVSISEAYFWFADHYDKIDIKLRYIPTAHVTHEEDKSFFKFFETTCFNKCIKVRMFMEQEEALNWLRPQ